MKRLETEHRARDPFEDPMILLDNVIQILYLQDLDQAVAAQKLEQDIGPFQPHQITVIEHSDRFC